MIYSFKAIFEQNDEMRHGDIVIPELFIGVKRQPKKKKLFTTYSIDENSINENSTFLRAMQALLSNLEKLEDIKSSGLLTIWKNGQKTVVWKFYRLRAVSINFRQLNISSNDVDIEIGWEYEKAKRLKLQKTKI